MRLEQLFETPFEQQGHGCEQLVLTHTQGVVQRLIQGGKPPEPCGSARKRPSNAAAQCANARFHAGLLGKMEATKRLVGKLISSGSFNGRVGFRRGQLHACLANGRRTTRCDRIHQGRAYPSVFLFHGDCGDRLPARRRCRRTRRAGVLRRMQRDGVRQVQPLTQSLGEIRLRLGDVNDGQAGKKTNES